MSLFTMSSHRPGGRGKTAIALALMLLCMTGYGRGENISGGARKSIVIDRSNQDLLGLEDVLNLLSLLSTNPVSDDNPMMGQNFGIEVPSVAIVLPSGAEIGLGGGDGGVGGGGGGGLSAFTVLDVLDPGELELTHGGRNTSGAVGDGFYGGAGQDLNVLGLVQAGLSAGGGGGLTQGGKGFNLLGLTLLGLDLNAITTAGLSLEGGGGGSLGITAADLGYDASLTISAPTAFYDGTTAGAGGSYAVSSSTAAKSYMNVFGGSGAGAGVSIDLGVVGDVVDELDNILGLLKIVTPSLTLSISDILDQILVAQDGYGASLGTVTADTGGVVNLLGGVGGGGGVASVKLDFDPTADMGTVQGDTAGGTGYGSVVDEVLITGGVVNVFGGAGGGANAVLSLGSNGGDGGGAKVMDGSMEAGILNIYSGADGGDVNNLLLGLSPLNLAVLDEDGRGGEGEGGSVTGLELTGGTMNLYRGTSANDTDALALYNMPDIDEDGVLLRPDLSGAKATDITNKGGTVNLAGGALTGTYTQQNHATLTDAEHESTLILAGGAYQIASGQFSGGKIVSRVVDTDLDGYADDQYAELEDITDDVAGLDSAILANLGSTKIAGATINGAVVTDAAGKDSVSGSNYSLLLDNPTLGASADLTLGLNVALKDSVAIGAGQALRIVGGSSTDKDGRIIGTYTQTAGVLNLQGADVAVNTDLTAINVNGGEVYASVADSSLTGVKFSGNVTTNVTDSAKNLEIINGEFNGLATDEFGIGTNVTLDNFTFKQGKVTLDADADLTTAFTQTGGVLTLAGARLAGSDSFDVIFNDNVATSGVATDVNIAATGTSTIDGASFAGNVHTTATGGGNSLVITNAAIGAATGDNLFVGDQVELQNATLKQGTITLEAGGDLSGTYHQIGGTLDIEGTAAVSSGVISGGTVTTKSGTDVTLSGITFDGSATPTAELGSGAITTTATGAANLLIDAATVTGTAALIIGDKVSMIDIVDMDSDTASITVNTGGTISGDTYDQSAGQLVLNTGSTFDAKTATISGGSLKYAGGTFSAESADFADSTLILAADGFNTANSSFADATISASGALRTLTDLEVTGVVTTTTESGGSLELDGITFGSGSGNNLVLGKAVTLLDATIAAAQEITLNAGSTLGADVILDGGTVTLATWDAGSPYNVADAEFKNGSILSKVAGAILEDAAITGNILAGLASGAVSGAGITMDNALIGGDANLTLGAGASLINTTLDEVSAGVAGSVILAGGSLGSGYVQNAGSLILDKAGQVADMTGAVLAGGSITAKQAGELQNGEVTGEIATTGALTMTDFTVKADMTLEGGATLKGTDDTTHTQVIGATVTVGSGGKIAGYYEQDADSALLLGQGGSAAGSDITSSGSITLDGSSLAGATINTSGELILKSGSTKDIAAVNISGGSVESQMRDGVLYNASFSGTDTITLKTDGQDGNSLKISNTTLNGGFDLQMEGGVTLENVTLLSGTVTVDAGSNIEGSYNQTTGGTLVLAGGDTSKITSATFSGGIIDVQEDATLQNVLFTGNTSMPASMNNKVLTMDGLTIDGADVVMELGNVAVAIGETVLKDGTVNLAEADGISGDYRQEGGSLNLVGSDLIVGGGLNSVTLAGGSVTGSGKTVGGATLDAGDGGIFTASGGVAMEDVVFKTGTLALDTGASLLDGNLTKGSSVSLGSGGLLTGDFSLAGGALELNGGNIEVGVNGLASAVLSTGSIDAKTAATITGVTINGAIDAIASTGSLDFVDTILDAGADLGIGNSVTLTGGSIGSKAAVTLNDGGTLDGVSLDGGMLNIATATGTANNLDLVSGTLQALVDGAELAGATVSGVVSAVAGKGATLDLSQVDIASADANLKVGSGVTVLDTTLDIGRITLEGTGALGADFTLDGDGILSLAGSDGNDVSGATFLGGIVESVAKGAQLIGATFENAIEFVTGSAGATLDVAEATIDLADGESLDFGAGTILSDATVNNGIVNLLAGSALAGTYQQLDGTLLLDGGDASKAEEAIFEGGEIVAAAASTLNGAVFKGLVDVSAADASLNLTNAVVSDGGTLELLENVTLTGGKLASDTGSIVLGIGSAIADTFEMSAGTFTLAGGDTSGAKSTFSGGDILATVADAVLEGATFTGPVAIDASAGALDLVGATIAQVGALADGEFTLSLGANTSLTDSILESGALSLESGSEVLGTFTQVDGLTSFDGGDASAAIMTFEAGEVLASAATDIGEAIFTGVVDVAAPTGELDFHKVQIIENADVTFGANSILEDTLISSGKATFDVGSTLVGPYTSTGGTTVLGGGDTGSAEADFSGGTLTTVADGKSDFTFGKVTITPGSGVTFETEGENTISIGETEINGGSLTAKEGIATGDTTINDGNLTMDGGKIDDSLTLNGGTLDLQQNDSITTKDVTLNNGTVKVGDGVSQDFDGIDLGDGDVKFETEGDGTIAFTGSTISGGSHEFGAGTNFDGDVTGGLISNTGGDFTMRSYTGGGYTQTAGTLYLGTGSYTPAVDDANYFAFGGGLLTTVKGETATLSKAVFAVGNTTAQGGESGGVLNLRDFDVTLAGGLTIGERVTVTDARMSLGGTLFVANGFTLQGNTSMSSFGGIAIDTASAIGGSATIAFLESTDTQGALNVRADLATGVADKFVVTDSDGGSYIVNSLSTGYGNATDVIEDVTGKASFDLAGGNYREEEIWVLEDSLTFRDGTGSSKIWSLDTVLAGFNSTAQMLGNAPAISLSQATIGMAEMSQQFSSLRSNRQAYLSAIAQNPGLADNIAVASLCDRADGCGMEYVPSRPSIWANSYVHHTNVENLGKASMNIYGLDLGFDKQIEASAGWINVGIMAGHQWVSNMKTEGVFSRGGEGSGKSWSLGAYAMWESHDGWFADVALRHFWGEMDTTSYTALNRAVASSSDRNAFALSAEAGKRITMDNLWYVEPSVGLTGIWIQSDTHRTSSGLNVEVGSTSSVEGKVGFAVGYAGERFSPYIEAALLHEFDGKTDVRINGNTLESDLSGTRGRIALGGSYKVSEAVSVFMEAAYEHGKDYRDINGNIGINFSW